MNKLQSAVISLSNSIKAKNSAIEEKIKEKDLEIEKFKKSISDLRQKAVEAELSNNTTIEQDLKNQINTFKTDLAELEEQKNAYLQVINKGDYSEELSEIKQLAIETREERFEEIKRLNSIIEDRKKQIEQINKEINDLQRQEGKLSHYQKEETIIEPIAEVIDKRAKTLDSTKKERFCRAWLTNRDTEVFFPPARAPLGIGGNSIKIPAKPEII